MRRSAGIVLLFAACATVSAQQYTISTIAGTGSTTAGFSGDGGPAINAQLTVPTTVPSIAVDGSGQVFITEWTIENSNNYVNNRIRKISASGTISTVAGNGASGLFGDGGQAINAQMTGPRAVVVDPKGNIYFAANARIRKITPDGIINTVAGTGVVGDSGDGGPAIRAQLALPEALALDAAGNLYICDTAAFKIRKVAPNGTITTIAGNGQPGYSGDGGFAINAKLNIPRGLAVDNAGNVYIADHGNRVIRKVTTTGTIDTIAPGILGAIYGIAVDSAANLYVTDSILWLHVTDQLEVVAEGVPASRTIRRISPDGKVTVIAGTGTAGYSGDGGPATRAQITAFATALAVDGSGNVFFEDATYNVVRVLKPVSTTPAITSGGVVPVYGSRGTIQPGSWVSIFGENLAAAPVLWKGDFPTTLGGTSVTINGKPAYLWFVGPTQINLQAPDDAATGTVNVVVTNANGRATASVTLQPYGPSFLILPDGKHVTAIVPTSGSGNSGSGYDIIGPTRPLKAGETVLLFGVGFGPTTPAVPAGAVFGGAAPISGSLQMTIGGVPVDPLNVQFAGMVGAGLYQINLVVPGNLGSGDKALLVTAGGLQTQNSVLLSLE